MVQQQQIILQTTGHGDMHDLTAEVAEVVAASGVHSGMSDIKAIHGNDSWYQVLSPVKGDDYSVNLFLQLLDIINHSRQVILIRYGDNPGWGSKPGKGTAARTSFGARLSI